MRNGTGREGAATVLDAKRDRLLLHGGDGGLHPTYGYTPLSDLWAYDLPSRFHAREG